MAGSGRDDRVGKIGGSVGCDGVFAAARNVAIFCQMILNGGCYGDVRILPKKLVAAMVANQLRVPVAHVEAGLRSFDRTMPEEINRAITDALSAYLFTPSPAADLNLPREGISPHRLSCVVT